MTPQTRRYATQSSLGSPIQRFLAFASGKNQPRRGAVQLYLGNGWHHLLSVHRPHLYRGIADVLLPSKQGAALPRSAVPRTLCALCQVISPHAPLGTALTVHPSRV